MAGLRKVYRSGLLETHALADVHVHIRPGEFVALMGPSGAGKTTFLQVAGLLESFEGGSYALDGEDVGTLSDRRASALRNQKIGFIFQSFQLVPDLDVFDNVEMPLRFRSMRGRERRERVTRTLRQLGLSARMHHVPGELSGGQQQRVAIARALVGEPAILLADEPTGNLDSRMARQVMELLEQINARGTTLVLVTHDAELAARARRRIHIFDGRVVDSEAPPSLVRSAS